MSVTCRACGRVNTEGAEFCANPDCGAYLGWEGRPDQGPGTGPHAGGGTDPGGQPPAGDDQRVGVRVTLADAVVAVDPGASGSTTLSVYNSGTQVEGFTITVSGPAAGWGAVEPPEISVYPEQTATVTLRFTPPRASSSPAGHAWYVVRLESTVHPGVAVTANGTTVVGAYHDVSAELAPATSSGRRTTRQQVVAHNRGNVVEHARLAATDDEGAFRMDLARSTVELPPGQTRVPLKVRAPWRWIGRRRSVPIHATLEVEGATAPVRADGTRHVVPVFPSWAPVALAAVLALAGGGTAALMALRSHRTPPSVPVAASSQSSSAPASNVAASRTPAPTVTSPAPRTTSPAPTVTSPAPSTTSPAATTPHPNLLGQISPADCISYNPANLKIYNAGAIGWRLVENLPSGQQDYMLILDNQTDAAAALALAQRHTSQCFIGRDNTRPNRYLYIVQYWKGRSGRATTISHPDCVSYNSSRLRIVNEGASGWLLTDGSSRMLVLDNQQDAHNALLLARSYSKQCFIGSDNTRSNRLEYIVDYWLP